MTIAVIPARGGSKRIPRKNIRLFAGKPMIAHSILAALHSNVFEEVIVSTDDPEIREIAIQYGAQVPFQRPPELSNDHATLLDVMAHSLSWTQQNLPTCEFLCCLYATAPFVSPDDIAAGLSEIKSGPWDYVFGATSYPHSIFGSFQRLSNGGVSMFFPEHFKTRSQDLPEAMHYAGHFCWGRTNAWREQKKIFDQWSTVVKIPRWRALDIDTEEDWTQAELLAGMMQLKND